MLQYFLKQYNFLGKTPPCNATITTCTIQLHHHICHTLWFDEIKQVNFFNLYILICSTTISPTKITMKMKLVFMKCKSNFYVHVFFWSSIYLENLIKFKFEPRYNQQMQVQLQCIFKNAFQMYCNTLQFTCLE